MARTTAGWDPQRGAIEHRALSARASTVGDPAAVALTALQVQIDRRERVALGYIE